MSVRVRFAPSPTGYLHVGGARTALFNYLFARHHQGTFILRIEDTDRTRYQETALREIFDGLRWLGLEWDEGPEKGGKFGPYFQSARTQHYKKSAEELIASGHAYRCFCSAERLAQVREGQHKTGGQAGYDRHCRELSPEEVEKNLSEGRPYVIRFKIPLCQPVVFRDMIRGEITYQSDVLDDLVLMKSDGFPTYHLANVVDDHLMEISHVLRGDEWIASTPRHVLIYQAFGWTPPSFAHLPVILAPGGGKLSKRKGAASVTDYRNAGYLPEALFNFLALLGWGPGDDREIMCAGEIAEAFSLDRVLPKPAVFDETKLEWMNGHYLQEAATEKLMPLVEPAWREKGWLNNPQVDGTYLKKVIDLMKVRSKKTTDLAESAAYFFVDPVKYDPKSAKKHFKADAVQILSALVEKLDAAAAFDQASLEKIYREYAESSGLSASNLIHPSRLAVSGVGFGPGLFELLEALGKETVVRRIRSAVEWLRHQNTKETV